MDHQQQQQQHQPQPHFQQPVSHWHHGYSGVESHEESISRHSPQHYERPLSANTMPPSLWNHQHDNNAAATGPGKRSREESSLTLSDTANSDSGLMDYSFKRLKVMDDCSSNADSMYSTITNYSSFEPQHQQSSSRFDAMVPQIKDDEHGVATLTAVAAASQHQTSSSSGSSNSYAYQNQNHHHHHRPEMYQRQVTTDDSMQFGEHKYHHQQTAGEQSASSEQQQQQQQRSSSGYQSMNSMLGDLHLMRRQRTAGDQPASQPPTPSMDRAFPPQQQMQQQQQQRHSFVSPTARSSTYKKEVSLRTSSKLY